MRTRAVDCWINKCKHMVKFKKMTHSFSCVCRTMHRTRTGSHDCIPHMWGGKKIIWRKKKTKETFFLLPCRSRRPQPAFKLCHTRCEYVCLCVCTHPALGKRSLKHKGHSVKPEALNQMTTSAFSEWASYNSTDSHCTISHLIMAQEN